MRETTKNVVVRERRYQIEKMTPLIACRIYTLFSAVIVKMAVEEMERASSKDNQPAPAPQASDNEDRGARMVKQVWLRGSLYFDDATAERIQIQCLKMVLLPATEDESAPSVRVMLDNGTLLGELNTDPVAVSELTLEVLQFNIAPFLAVNPSVKQP